MIGAPRRFHGLIGALLVAVHPGPPTYPGETWFCADLAQMDGAELRREQRRLQLRLLLTAPQDRGRWPVSWLEDRLARVGEELRRRGRGR